MKLLNHIGYGKLTGKVFINQTPGFEVSLDAEDPEEAARKAREAAERDGAAEDSHEELDTAKEALKKAYLTDLFNQTLVKLKAASWDKSDLTDGNRAAFELDGNTIVAIDEGVFTDGEHDMLTLDTAKLVELEFDGPEEVLAFFNAEIVKVNSDLTVPEPVEPEPEPVDPETIEAEEVSKAQLEVAIQGAITKLQAGEEVSYTDLLQIQRNWEMANTAAGEPIVIEGAKLAIPDGAVINETDLSTIDKFTAFVASKKPGAAPAVVVPEDRDPEAVPETVASDADVEQDIRSLETLTGKPLQEKINELAEALNITLEGRGTENGKLKVDGDVGRGTRAAQSQIIEALRQKLPIEGDNYLSAVDEMENPSAEDIINAVKGNPVHARLLQKDLRNLGLYSGRIDGILGGGSRRALVAGLEKHGNIKALEVAARQAEVVKEGKSNGGRNPSVDALMAKIRSGAEITAEDVAFTGKETGGSTDRTREILDFIEQASADSEISGTEAGRIIEMMLAEDKYNADVPQGEVISRTLYEGSGGFIIGLSRVNRETRVREVSTKLRDRIRGRASRDEMAADMLKSESTLDLSKAEGTVEIDGHKFDIETLRKLYILTGQGQTAQGKGAVELPIGELTSSLKIHNLVYRDGALIGTMENGCEGNLVIIPVDRQYVRYVPPKPPRRVVTPRPVRQPGRPAPVPEDEDEPVPETGGGTYTRKVCNQSTGYYEICTYRKVPGWGGLNDQKISCEPTNERCVRDGDDDNGDDSGDGKGGSGNSGRSDRRWKEQITPIENALAKVSEINGVNYYWKDEHKAEMGDQLEIGVIAQDVQKVFPEAVITDENDELLVKYDKLVGALVEAVKELKTEIDELKKNQ